MNLQKVVGLIVIYITSFKFFFKKCVGQKVISEIVRGLPELLQHAMDG